MVVTSQNVVPVSRASGVYVFRSVGFEHHSEVCCDPGSYFLVGYMNDI